jgi:hypothetical protein
MCASFSFLCVRIFSSVVVAFKSSTQPSGFVPGWDWTGAASMLLAAGGLQGLDCVFIIFFRVFSAMVWGLAIISIFFEGLFVSVHPSLE